MTRITYSITDISLVLSKHLSFGILAKKMHEPNQKQTQT